MNLYIDPDRFNPNNENTGIYVRAQLDGKWMTAPIESLTFESLFKWLRSRNGENVWAENVVVALLGYEERIEQDMLPQQDEEDSDA